MWVLTPGAGPGLGVPAPAEYVTACGYGVFSVLGTVRWWLVAGTQSQWVWAEGFPGAGPQRPGGPVSLAWLAWDMGLREEAAGPVPGGLLPGRG